MIELFFIFNLNYMAKKQCYRHGEILFVKINKLPKGLRETKTNIIVKGSHEHNHEFTGGKIYLTKVDENVFGYFVAKNTTLLHPDHGEGEKIKEAKLPNGTYELRIQQEYTPAGLVPVRD